MYELETAVQIVLCQHTKIPIGIFLQSALENLLALAGQSHICY